MVSFIGKGESENSAVMEYNSLTAAKRAVQNLLSGKMMLGEERFIYAMIARRAEWKRAWLELVNSSVRHIPEDVLSIGDVSANEKRKIGV